MVRNSEIAYRSREEIKAFQEAGLRDTLKYVYENSPFYKRLYDENGIDPDSVRTLEDLVKLPVTGKKDLQLFNQDFICVPQTDIIDYVTTSGTLGEPVAFALTESDLQRLSYNEVSSFSMAGCAKGDIMQLMTTLDRRFMAGLAYFMGARELGLGVVRVGNGIPELQWDTIKRVKPTHS